MTNAVSPLIDIGINLTHPSFHTDLHEVVSRAKRAGVHKMILTGTSIDDTRAALTLANEFPETMFVTAGIHPHHASEFSDKAIEGLRSLVDEEKIVAIGECGLDFFRNLSPHKIQRECFRQQLKLAYEKGLPVFLHEREAHSDFISILKESRISSAVVHCFTGSESALRDYLSLGCFIGITGWICDERRGGELQKLLPLIPEDRLMIETDSPFLLPRDLIPKPRSRRNEPMHLAHIARVVAEIRGVSFRTLASQTTANVKSFFNLPESKNWEL